jgi:hypothetical protein
MAERIMRPGTDWRCPKCGTGGTSYARRFHPATRGENWDEPERIKLSCNVCGYWEWRLPLDAD